MKHNQRQSIFIGKVDYGSRQKLEWRSITRYIKLTAPLSTSYDFILNFDFVNRSANCGIKMRNHYIVNELFSSFLDKRLRKRWYKLELNQNVGSKS